MLNPDSLPAFQSALADARVDGWLLFDFRGVNPVAKDLLRIEGMATRRVLAWIPTRGTPVALTHAIEQGPWRHWPTARSTDPPRFRETLVDLVRRRDAEQ